MVANGLILKDRSLLAVSGKDAQHFLQGLISGDIHKVTAEHCIYATMLTPQGKFLYDFFITAHDDGYLLDVASSQREGLAKKLGFYKLRSQVQITPRDDLQVAALWDDHAPTLCCGAMVKTESQLPLVLTDPRLAALGMRVIGTPDMLEQYLAQAHHVGPQDYLHHRLVLGVPDGAIDLEQEKSLLLMWGIDRLGGVDFAKGCYVGQEVTARSHHRAQLRKYIHLVKAHEDLPETGTPITRDGEEIGKLASRSGHIGIALLPLTDCENNAECGVVMCGDVHAHAHLPPWLESEHFERVTL